MATVAPSEPSLTTSPGPSDQGADAAGVEPHRRTLSTKGPGGKPPSNDTAPVARANLEQVIVSDRTDAIAILDDGHQQIVSLIDGLSDAQMTRRRTIGGGDWSVKDLVAHMTTWEQFALEALDAWRAGNREPLREALKSGGTDAVNAGQVARKARMPLERVLADFRSVHGQLIDEVKAMPEWDDVPPGRRSRTVGSVIGSITGGPGGGFRHAWAHLEDLREYVGSLG
jgi:uncharacterized protein (TIGR03083 family)